MNGASPTPAPSLRELSSECETEGVSSDGCSMPTIYTPAHINSEIFECLRSPKYTPSASLRSAAPSEREPGNVPIQRATQKPQRCGRFSSPLRKLRNRFLLPLIGGHSLSHALLGVTAPSEREPGAGADTIQLGTCEAVGVRAIFIVPTKLREFDIPPLIERHSLSHALWA